MESKGVVYLNILGNSCAERLVVSLWSLRRYYDGPIAILYDDASEDITRIIAQYHGVQAERIPFDTPTKPRRNKAYVCKTLMPHYSPYERTVFLDADTLIEGPIDPLFDWLDSNPVIVTQFAEWVTTGRKMKGRIRKLSGISPLVDAAIDHVTKNSYPALNTGVMGWQRNAPFLADWQALGKALSGRFIADELAAQLALPGSSHLLLDDRWNCSPIYGQYQSEAVIWHFHGGKHLKKEQGRRLWAPAFRECMMLDFAEVARWGGQYDTEVREWLDRESRS